MTRTRSEYRRSLVGFEASVAPPEGTRAVGPGDRDALAALMLDAYRGTIDDEGETFDDALAAVDEYYALMVPAHSIVAADRAGVVAMSFVVIVDGVHYIDPVAVAAGAKRRGLGRGMVEASLASLLEAGVTEVGATITDGNLESERLFTSLRFERVGAWG